MPELDIAEVARRCSVTPSTLRYYEEKGLIASAGRRGLRRQFPKDVLDRLALITLGRVAGFSLDEIGGMFSSGEAPRIDRAKLVQKADELDETIRRLSAVKDCLRHVAACPAESHLECSTFRRLMQEANAGVLPKAGAVG